MKLEMFDFLGMDDIKCAKLPNNSGSAGTSILNIGFADIKGLSIFGFRYMKFQWCY